MTVIMGNLDLPFVYGDTILEAVVLKNSSFYPVLTLT